MGEYRTYTNKDGGINDTSALTFAAISRTNTGSEASTSGIDQKWDRNGTEMQAKGAN